MKLTSVKLNVFIIMGSLLLLTGSIPLRTEDFTVSTIKCIVSVNNMCKLFLILSLYDRLIWVYPVLGTQCAFQ